MNKDSKQVAEFLTKFNSQLNFDKTNVLIGLAPASIHLAQLGKHDLCTSNMIFAVAQDVSAQDKGAFTGEISSSMVSDYVSHVLVGHSERREYFNESIDILFKKTLQCYSCELIPVFCFGEKLSDRDKGDYLVFLKKQLLDFLDLLLDYKSIDYSAGNLILAYEPVWAIGTGNTANINQIVEVHDYIRSILIQRCGEKGETIPIVYGGSCNSDNANAILSQKNVGGLLIGNASLDCDHFLKIIKQTHGLC